MESICALSPKVSIKTIVIPLVDRIAAYAARRREEVEKNQPAGSESPAGSSAALSPKTDSGDDAAVGSKQVTPGATNSGSAGLGISAASEQGSTEATSDDDEDEGEANATDNSVDEIQASVAAASLEDNDVKTDIETQEDAAPAVGQDAADTDDDDSEEKSSQHSAKAKPSDLEALAKLFDSFWDHVGNLIEARPDLPLQDAIAICTAMLRLSLSCNPQPSAPVDNVLAFVRALPRAHELTPGVQNPATANQLLSLLLGPLRAYANPLKVLELANYGSLLEAQTERTRKSVAVALLTAILQRNTTMSTKEEVAGITRLCASLITKSSGSQLGSLGDLSANKGKLANTNSGAAESSYASTPLDEDDIAEEQGLLARLVHLIHGPDVISQLSLLTVVRDAFSQGGDLVSYTYPAVVAGAARLLGPFAAMRPDAGAEAEHAEWLRR
ncbi:retromer complex subunit Vps35, partial [Kickxella alabastrina]